MLFMYLKKLKERLAEHKDGLLLTALILYVILLVVATVGEICKIQWILDFF